MHYQEMVKGQEGSIAVLVIKLSVLGNSSSQMKVIGFTPRLSFDYLFFQPVLSWMIQSSTGKVKDKETGKFIVKNYSSLRNAVSVKSRLLLNSSIRNYS